jgi:hypothetical protein
VHCCAASSFLVASLLWVIFDVPNSSVRGKFSSGVPPKAGMVGSGWEDSPPGQELPLALQKPIGPATTAPLT